MAPSPWLLALACLAALSAREGAAAAELAAKACRFDAELCRRARETAIRLGAPAGTPEEERALRFEAAALSYDIETLAEKIKAAEVPGIEDEEDLDKKRRLTAEGNVVARQVTEAFDAIMEPALAGFRARVAERVQAETDGIVDEMGRLSLRLAEVEAEAAALPAGASKAEREALAERLKAVSADGGALWRRLQRAALEVDGTGEKTTLGVDLGDGAIFPQTTRAGVQTEALNPLQERLAELARRAQAAAGPAGIALNYRDLRLTPPKPEAISGRLADPFAPGDKRDSLLALRPAKEGTPVPPDPRARIDFGKDGVDMFPDETAAVARLRRAGLTLTVGAPEARRTFAFKQTGSVCGVAAQAMLLADLGGVRPTKENMQTLTVRLYREAVAKGYFAGAAADPKRQDNGWTPGAHMGSLLNVPTRRSVNASVEELDAAVKSGRMVIVSGATRVLWNDPKDIDGSHAFVITGAELDKNDGRVLCYFINDTGSGEGARCVGRRQLQGAWLSDGGYILHAQ